jgi:glyoxylase-like metal-dependent hydrolase (beta-lactamase superfamily II)
MGFTEVADRVWVARHEWFDVNVTVVAGSDGVLVVDTHASDLAARAVIDDLRRLSAAAGLGPVSDVVNTHAHFDHTFGNAAFARTFEGLRLHAHDVAAAETLPAGERIKAVYGEPQNRTDPHREEILGTQVLAADHTFSSALVIDLGDRQVELVHPGRGHTAGDLVVRVPDADVVLTGDLIEESGPPCYNSDAWPLEWPQTIETLTRMLTSATVVVPGHGAVVDHAFVQDQGFELGQVARSIYDLAAQGVSADEALAAGEWPWPVEHLGDAVRLGYEHLPRSSKRLPLA